MIVIFNPAAGQRRAQTLWRVLDVLASSGVRLSIVETRHAGHARTLAESATRDGEDLVVTAGGDGTIAEVAAGITAGMAGCTHTPAMGVIPIGTANVLARELKLPFAPRAVASALAFGRTRRLWPGIARGPEGERLFVQMLGVGLDAQVVHHLPLGLKRFAGRLAYVAQTLREMPRYCYAGIRAEIDGRKVEAASIIVCKGTLYAGPFTLAPDAQPGEPGFTVALFGARGPMGALMYGAALPLNLLPYAPGLILQRAKSIKILGSGASRVMAQADGDPAGNTPLEITDSVAPLRIVVG